MNPWISAARPRTLPVSAAPVIAASACAWHYGHFRWQPALLCLLFALLAQVASNLANDYFDFVKGCDTAGRVGPRRAVASGDIAPRTMLYVTLATLGVACCFGLGLLYYGGWWLLPVGMVIALCALAYTAGPYPLAYHGLGDVAVFVFFGLVPVNLTYYVQALAFNETAFWLSVAMGLLSINLLLVNNYRDREEDEAANKRTTVVIFGRRFAEYAYLTNGILGVILLIPVWSGFAPGYWLMPLGYLVLHVVTWSKIRRLRGMELNPFLGATARNQILYAVLISLAWCLS